MSGVTRTRGKPRTGQGREQRAPASADARRLRLARPGLASAARGRSGDSGREAEPVAAQRPVRRPRPRPACGPQAGPPPSDAWAPDSGGGAPGGRVQAASGQTHGAGPFTLRDAFSSTAEKGFSDVHSVCVGPVRGRVETRGVREAPPPRHRVGGPASEGVTFSLLSIRRLLKGGCGRCQGSSATVGATRRPAWRPAVPAWPSPALSPRPVCGAWGVGREEAPARRCAPRVRGSVRGAAAAMPAGGRRPLPGALHSGRRGPHFLMPRSEPTRRARRRVLPVAPHRCGGLRASRRAAPGTSG